MQWQVEHDGQVSSRTCWLIAAIVPLLGAPFALGCALFTVEYLGVVCFAVLAPTATEVLKIAIPSLLVERRGHLIQSVSQLCVMTLGTALAFAVVQNAVYVLVYFKPAPIELVVYRWLIGPLLHVLPTAIATQGLLLTWRQARQEQRPPSVAKAYPWLIAAILVHALYNTCVDVGGHLGYGF